MKRLLAACALSLGAAAQAAGPCTGTIYLSFDTGSQSQAELIAQTLKAHNIRATFFLANEKTVRGDYSLDPSWAEFWKARVAEGHAFGSHTFDHVYLQPSGKPLTVRPQFGEQAGKVLQWTPAEYCQELKRVDERFHGLTGSHLDPIWRAPGGRASAAALDAAKRCGFTHFAWAAAGFTGDELPSEKFSNASLLQRMLRDLKDGDIVMGHMGIWSRKDPWMPANLEALINGLEQRGFCFATLREHPDYPKQVTP